MVFGFILAFGFVWGMAQATSQTMASEATTATILYVDAEATGAATGLDWSNAYTTVQDALTVAISGTEIWVAEGVYYPDEGVGQINDWISSTFALTDGVALYGGFDPSSGIDEFAERDWETYVTVLSGDIDKNDTTDPHGVVITTTHLSGMNTYHVVSIITVTSTVIDGFSITAGHTWDNSLYPLNTGEGGGIYSYISNPTLANLTFSGNLAYYGGGIFNLYGHPTLDNVFFSGNSANQNGGGMYNEFSSPSLSNVNFSNNFADHLGGGFFNANDSSPVLDNVAFFHNSGSYLASSGGGMYNANNSNPLMSDVIFSSNSAGSGGGMYNSIQSNPILTDVIFSDNSAWSGGGMVNSHESNPSLINLTFSDNSAGSIGGGLLNQSGSSPILKDVTFSSNSANHGGGIYNSESSPVLTNVTFSSNTAHIMIHGGGGGGMSNNGNSNPTLSNVEFLRNHAGVGGGMYNSENSHPALSNVTFVSNWGMDYGGGMYISGNPALNNVTFTDNYAYGPGGGMYIDGSPILVNVIFSSNSTHTSGGGMYNSGNPMLINVTFAGNHAEYGGGGIYNTEISTPTLSNTILWGNTSPISGTQIHNETGSIVLISYSDIQGCGGSGTGWDAACGTDLGNNIAADPLFMRNPDPGSDGNWDGLDDDYGDLHLRAGSPAIDTGTNSGCPSTDLDGTPRPVNAICDMGAYEYLNLPPVAVDDSGLGFSTDKDIPFTIASVLANDWDPNDDPLTITSVDTSGILGLITDHGDGTFYYDPNSQFDYLAPGESATETFTYTLSDGQGGSDTATVTITVVDYYFFFLPLVMKQ